MCGDPRSLNCMDETLHDIFMIALEMGRNTLRNALTSMLDVKCHHNNIMMTG